MPIARCPNCFTSLDVDAAWIGRTIRCGQCRTDFVAVDEPPPQLPRATPATPRRSEPRDEPARSTRRRGDDDDDRRRRDDDEDRPRRRRRDDDEDDFDDRPRRKMPRKKSGGSWLPILIILGILVMCCGGGGYWVYSEANEPVKFEDSAWKDYSISDGSCSAKFPAPPVNEPLYGTPGVTGNKQIYNATGLKDAAMLLGYIDYSNPYAGLFERACQLERDEIKSAINGRVVRETPIRVQGFEAKEYEFESQGVTIIYRLIHMPGQFKTRIIMLMAGGRNLSVADRTKFIESFKVKGKN